MLFIRWASICVLHNRLIMLLFYTFFDTWRALSSMAFSTQLSLHLYSMHSLTLIEQEIPLIAGPLRVIAFSLVLIWFLSEVRNKLLWSAPLRWFLKDLGVSTSSTTPLYCDNQGAIHIAHNDVFHEWTKHIEIDCHFIRYHLIHGALKLFSVSSKDQLVDIFTKSHPKGRLRDLVDNLKLVSHPPWVWGGLLTCIMLWALGLTRLLV